MAGASMKRGDILAVILIVPTCLYVFYESTRWPIPALLGNPLLIPRGVAICLLVAAGTLLYRALTGRALPLPKRLEGGDLRRVSGAVVLTFAYVFAVERVGFIGTTVLYLAGFGLVLGERGWLRLLLFAILVPLVVYAIFDTMLHVPLPQGWFR